MRTARSFTVIKDDFSILQLIVYNALGELGSVFGEVQRPAALEKYSSDASVSQRWECSAECYVNKQAARTNHTVEQTHTLLSFSYMRLCKSACRVLVLSQSSCS